MDCSKTFYEISHFIHFDKEIPYEDRGKTAKPQLVALISELESNGYLLGAGMVASHCLILFWGDWENSIFFSELALRLFEKESLTTKDPLRLAVTHMERLNLYGRLMFPGAPQNIELQAKNVYHRRAAAEILSKGFASDPHKEAYLVTGFHLTTNFADIFTPEFVDYEVEEREGLRYGEMGTTIPIPSAFQLFISISDYENALEVGKYAPNGFKYPGVCGWREVCQGFLAEKEAYKHYLKAAEFFAGDTPPEEGTFRKKPHWSGLNLYILAPYFRARAALSKYYSNSEQIIETLKIASNEIKPNESSLVYVPARKLAILVHGLGSFLATNDESVLDELSKNYQKEINLWGQYAEDDKILLEGLTLIKQAVEGFRYNPTQEIISGRLSQGIQILETIPEWSQMQFVPNIAETFGKTALEISQGVTYNDVAATLQTITDEQVLQQLVLELLKARAPYHAKVTHGPIEWGKDVVAIIDDEGTPRLHMYAIKAGDIDSRKWPSAKEAIDQMFTVSIDNPLVTQHQPSTVHGFLVFNGHFNQHIDPVANAWLSKLRSEKNWDIQVYDIDGLSKWIVSNRLVGVVRKFMKVSIE